MRWRRIPKMTPGNSKAIDPRGIPPARSHEFEDARKRLPARYSDRTGWRNKESRSPVDIINPLKRWLTSASRFTRETLASNFRNFANRGGFPAVELCLHNPHAIDANPSVYACFQSMQRIAERKISSWRKNAIFPSFIRELIKKKCLPRRGKLLKNIKQILETSSYFFLQLVLKNKIFT